jgi:tellurite resistance protein TehA-like permease
MTKKEEVHLLFGIFLGALLSAAASMMATFGAPYLEILYEKNPLLHVGIFFVITLVFFFAIRKLYQMIKELSEQKK